MWPARPWSKPKRANRRKATARRSLRWRRSASTVVRAGGSSNQSLRCGWGLRTRVSEGVCRTADMGGVPSGEVHSGGFELGLGCGGGIALSHFLAHQGQQFAAVVDGVQQGVEATDQEGADAQVVVLEQGVGHLL